MTDIAAFMTAYRDEHVAAFERKTSKLRMACTTEAVIKGNQATFLVAGSGGASAVTRGSNGKIPYGSTSNNQLTATLAEKHAPFERTSFNIFASQGDQKRIMQEGSVSVLNRDIDDTIIAQLDTASTSLGAATTASLNLVQHAQVALGENDVDIEDEDNMFFLGSPAFRGYLMQIPEFASADYVDVKMFNGPTVQMRRWAGFQWVFHTGVTGVGTASEKCYAWHRGAMGHAANSEEMQVFVDYDKKQDLSWSRATLYHGAKLLQQSGIMQVLHDGSGFATS